MRSPISPGPAAESTNPNPGILLLKLGGGIPALLGLLQGEMMEAAMAYAASRQLSQFIFAVAFFHSSEYALAAFFHGRSNVTLSCEYEEFFLRQFFGFQYVEYAKRVPSGLPFIR
ncbi:hypothetical protein BHE74_00029876 [Ensete ventricosum]|nr:hypothetical protein BHE74_00029876 [Ensete ventricosum]